MEVGPDQDPSGLQRTSHRFYTTAVISLHSQTELAINTHNMVLDVHRAIVHGQEGNNNKVSVSSHLNHRRTITDHSTDSSQW